MSTRQRPPQPLPIGVGQPTNPNPTIGQATGLLVTSPNAPAAAKVSIAAPPAILFLSPPAAATIPKS